MNRGDDVVKDAAVRLQRFLGRFLHGRYLPFTGIGKFCRKVLLVPHALGGGQTRVQRA